MLGTACLSSPRRLVLNVVALSDMPVTFPPGRAKLATRPVATGSPAPTATTVGTPVPYCMVILGWPALAQHGCMLGQNLEISYYGADVQLARLPQLARDIAATKVDVWHRYVASLTASHWR